MKIRTNKYHLIIIVLLPAFLLGPACRKTDKYYNQLSNTPEIYTALRLDYSRLANGVTRQYHVGDTLGINGRFDATASRITVQIGGVNVAVIDVLKKDSINHRSDVTYYNSMETIRVLLTSDMGTGRLPVKVSCRGFELEGPMLYLIPKGSVAAVTDTLVWKEFFRFKGYPFNNGIADPLVDSFLSMTVFYPSYSGTGNIFFGTRTQVQLLHPDGSITPVTALENLTDARGSFKIIKMYNGAVDQKERTLYFSALTSDNYKSPGTNGTAVDADSNWIFRYCKLDLVSKQLQVMNRTIFPFYQKKYSTLGTGDQVQALYAGEGQVSQVNMPLFSAAWANDQGEVYFSPIGLSYTMWDFDRIAGKLSGYPYIFSNTYLGTPYNYLGKITPDGQVQYIMKSKSDWPGDGPVSPRSQRTTILSLDPVKGIMFTSVRIGSNLQIVFYDLKNRSVVSKLYPTTRGAGATGPFNLLDAMTPTSGGAIQYGGGAGENGTFLSLPGPSARYLYDYENVVYDFTKNEAYRYAPVMIDSVKYQLSRFIYYEPLAPSRADLPAMVLNYDQQGNLYKLAFFYKTFNPYQLFYDVRRTYVLKH